jgi:hypothetical protein
MKKANMALSVATCNAELTFTRYKYEEFKNTKARTVPYEDIDYTKYKPSANCVAFLTSEDIGSFTG